MQIIAGYVLFAFSPEFEALFQWDQIHEHGSKEETILLPGPRLKLFTDPVVVTF